MRKLAFKNDFLAIASLFVMCLYFYINSLHLNRFSNSTDKRLARPVTDKWERPPEPQHLNPELKLEPIGNVQRESEQKTLPKFVILLASLPRSGSTMISELLRSRQNTVLFFEPDHKTEFTTCATVPNCISQYIRSILTCTFNDEFENWQRNKFFGYFHLKVAECRDMSCKLNLNIRKMCQEADFPLTKLIRVPLGFLEVLLSDPTVDAKIIHLIRDPRPTIISNKKMGWVSNPLLRCTKVYDDQLSYEYLHEQYPHKIMQMKYEKFCLNPTGATKSMFSFAFGDQVLSEQTINHLKKHTDVKFAGGEMNTMRNSSDQYQDWRWKIRDSLLKDIEKEKVCQMSIQKLNYRLFNTINNVRNISMSLFLD